MEASTVERQLKPQSYTTMRRGAFVGTAGAGLLAALPSATTATVAASDAKTRPDLVYALRVAAAAMARSEYGTSIGNGDEERYAGAGYIGSYTKGLPHAADGTVSAASYQSMIRALESGNPLLLDPQASVALRYLVGEVIYPNGEMAGCDYTGFSVPPAPALASARTAADMIELYWLALTRDVPYADYEEDPTIAKACSDLSRLTDFEAPRSAGKITPQTIFRGPGNTLPGPYVSQFFWLDVPVELGEPFHQRRAMPARHDSLTSRAAWLSAQNGDIASELTPRDGTKRYMQTGRDLTDYVWQLSSAIAWRNAAAIIEGLPSEARTGGFDYDDIVAMMAFSTNISGAATMFAKMFLQRRLRPEALGGLIDRGMSSSPLHSDIWTTPAVDLVGARYKTHLLPQAYLEGSPTHPSYPAGHGTLAGTGLTVLKAVTNEAYVLPAPMVPSRDGMRLERYTGPPLTIGSELDKLAANIALGRGTAGVHYRTDSYAGLRNGEAAALSFMRARVAAIGRGGPTYRLKTIDGLPITIASGSKVHVPTTMRSM